MKTKLLKNKTMSPSTYLLRRSVIKLIYEAKKMTKLPRILVRITEKHDSILGVAKMGKCVIWIPENAVISRAVVFHEILHAVFNQEHVVGCPLMDTKINPKLAKSVCVRLFIKYSKNKGCLNGTT